MSNLLAAPALFFWGVGTSAVGQESFGWSDSSSSAALAVATIVIPALDAFFASRQIGRYYDKASVARSRSRRPRVPRASSQVPRASKRFVHPGRVSWPIPGSRPMA